MDTTVLGLGYVGAVASAALAQAGHNVLGVDVDRAKVNAFQQGTCPLFEPGLLDLVSAGMETGRLRFAHVSEVTRDLGEAAVIAVGTPTSRLGGSDLSQVRSAVRWVLARGFRSGILVMKSTVPPGTGIGLCQELLEGSDVKYVSNPEFLREGQALEDWFRPDRIVVGAEDEGAGERVARELFAGIDAPVVITDITSAEMIKYASNAFLATKISFINEIANVCDGVGANVDHVVQGMGLDGRIGPAFLRPGLGFGGSCFPKDARALEYLAAGTGHSFELLRAVVDVNNRQRRLPIRVLKRVFGPLRGTRIALLGLAFKPGTDDVREAPALDIAWLLAEEGAEVRATDPEAMATARPHLPEGVALCESPAEALEGAQAAVLATEWPEFLSLPWKEIHERMAPPRFILDGRNALDGKKLQGLGFSYRGIGRSGIAWEGGCAG